MYSFNGKTYKTVTGIGNALMRDCGANAHSMVRNGEVTCYIDSSPVAKYMARMQPDTGELNFVWCSQPFNEEIVDGDLG